MPTLTLTENGANGRAHDWSHVWTPFTEVRTLLNTTGLDYANVQTNGIRPSNVRSYQQVEMGRQRVRNATGGSLPISTIVYISGSYNDGTDDYPTVAKAQARSDGASLYAQGITEAVINDASDGTILFFKEVTGLNTSDDAVGDRVYLSGTVGLYTTTIPAAGTAVQIIGQVSKSHASTGVISFSFPGAVSPVAAALRVTEASGALTTSGTLSTTGAATVASLVCTAGGTFGGGYGGTGASISDAGVLQAKGAITSDGAVTGASLAGTISTATQNSITSASSLATVGTITSGTWSGVIDGSATMTLGSDATGDTYYRDASGFLERLAASTDGYVLTATGAGSIPAWEAAPTGVSLSGSDNNTIVTVTGASAMQGEAALTFDGFTLIVTPPSAVNASESAKKIIPVMLDDPSTIWDLQAFLQTSRNTSWWVELGAPPIHGAMWINEAQTELVWWNLDTNAQYMGFDTGGSAYNDKTAVGQSDISDLAFLDGVLYVTRENAKGMSIIDFVRDGVTGYETNHTLMAGDIGDRNTNNVWTQYRVMPVYDLTMVSVDAIRDPSLVDAFGRPKHWWIVGSSATLKKYSIYNPIADAIYDGIHAHASNVVAVAPSGPYAYLRNDSGAFDYLYLMPSIFAISADDPAPDGYMFISSDNGGDPGFGETPWSSSVVIQDAVWMDDAGPDGEPIVAVGQDEGLTFAIVKGGPYDSSAFNMNADFASPLQVGKCFASYPLEGLADVSGSGNTLTDQGSVSFATAGVIGKGATFDGTGTNYLVSGTSLGAMGQFGYMMFWFKSASASNPSAIEYIVELADVTNDRWRVYANTDGTISLQLTDDGGSTHDTLTTAGDFYDGTWHHVAAYYDLSPALDQYLMIDGQVVAKDDGTVTAAVSAGNFDRISFGGSYAGASLYTGMIDQFVCGGSNEMSSYPGGVGSGGGPNFLNCARWEQQRGRRALQSGITADDALSNADVNSVRADQASKHWIICTADNNITLLDQFGVAILQDAVPSGTLRDAAVWTNDGQDIPSYAIAGSSDVELVQQARRILG